jgi:hypothetical protein
MLKYLFCHCTFHCLRDILFKTEYTANMYLHLHLLYMNTFLWSIISPMTDGYETRHNKSTSNTNITNYQDKI